VDVRNFVSKKEGVYAFVKKSNTNVRYVGSSKDLWERIRQQAVGKTHQANIT
jgi:excinuclease UvrABC nuclease subunit